MTAPNPYLPAPHAAASPTRLVRLAIWVAIGALIAAAIVCVVWVLIGPANDIIARAFLTILLLAGFAGVTILDAHLAPRRPAWFALASMCVWVVLLLIGAFLIWMPERYDFFGYGVGRLFSYTLIVVIMLLALLHVRLYLKAHLRHVTAFTRAVTAVTIFLVGVLAIMLVIPLMLNEFFDFSEWYWRIVVAITILAAVGTALIPLMNVLFAPRAPRVAAQASAAALLPWPTYVDGVTPLPILPDNSPDWNAYYTGHPSPGAQVIGGPAAPSAAAPTWPTAPTAYQGHPASPTGYQGYPPPPPLPPRP